MIYSIVPKKDTTLCNASSSMNAGLDEILEITKTIPSSGSATTLSRSLVKFDLSTLYLGSSTSGSRTFKLKLYATQPENIPLDYSVEIASVSQSWSMGNGRMIDYPVNTAGTSWDYKTNDTVKDYWKGTHSDTYGGTWYSGSGQITTQSFSYQSADIELDVTPIVEQWIKNTIPNEGFIIKFTSAEELDVNSYGKLKFFSADTNTVYKPRLSAWWDDSTFASGSLLPIGNNSVVYIQNRKMEYKTDSVERISVLGRDRYITKNFVVSASQYVDFKYLPTSSYYAVKDAFTGEYVIPFDTTNTKLSCDSNGNFFNFNFGTLPINRLCKFVFKTVRGTITESFDNDFIFRVVR